MCQECQEIEVGHSESSEAWDQTVEYGSEEKLLNSGIKEEVSGKVCTKCGEWKPLTEFCSDRRRKDGCTQYCKACRNVHERWKRSPDFVSHKAEKFVSTELRLCSKCGEMVPVTEFRKDKNKIGGYRSYCKKCSNKYERYRESDSFVPLKDTYVIPDKKTCTMCGLTKALTEYHATTISRDGHIGMCKSCVKIYQKELAIKNEERFRVFGKPLSKVCSVCLIELSSSEFYAYSLSRSGLSYMCKKCTKEKYRPFGDVPINCTPCTVGRKICTVCKEEKDLVDFGACKYHTDGRTSHCKACAVKRAIFLRQTDIQYRLREALRKRLHYYIEMGDALCSADALSFLGCTVEELKLKIERCFYRNPETNEMMSWDNYGAYGWHIDHIVPLAIFDLNDPNQVYYACRFDNLRPLWRAANLSKGSRLDEDWKGYEEYTSLLMFEDEMELPQAV